MSSPNFIEPPSFTDPGWSDVCADCEWNDCNDCTGDCCDGCTTPTCTCRRRSCDSCNPDFDRED